MAIPGKFDNKAIWKHVVVIIVLLLFLLGVKFAMSHNESGKHLEAGDTSVLIDSPVDSSSSIKEEFEAVSAPSEVKGDNTLCSNKHNKGDEALLITGDNVRVRSEASSAGNDNILFKLGKKDLAIVIGRTINQDGELWYNICFQDFTGWVIGKYGKLFQMGEDFKSILNQNEEGRTRLMKMVFKGYSEGDYPHLIFKELDGASEFDFRFLSDNNYDGLRLLLDDPDAIFGYKANPELINRSFLISTKKKEVIDADLDGNTIKSREWCITGIRSLE